MLDPKTIAELTDLFVDSVPDLYLCKKGLFLPNTSGSSNRQYLKPHGLFKALYDRLDKSLRTHLNKNFSEVLEDLKEGVGGNELAQALTRKLSNSSRNEDREKPTTDASAQFFNDTIKAPLSELKLIFNVKDRKRSFLYDEKRDLVHLYDYEFISMRLKQLLGEGYAEWVQTNSDDCVLEYRPLKRPRISLDQKSQVKVFNMWSEAEWRKGLDLESTDAEPHCPPLIWEYLCAFLPQEEDRQTILAWLRDCAFARAEPILVLCGRPGAGKNILIENIAGRLVGMHNYRSASRGFNKTQFHNNVTQCRLFFLDEMNLTPDSRETLKAYHNGTATIERKGKDVTDPEKIYASFALANNHPNKIKLEYTDRKFYMPILSDVPLLQALGQKKIDEIIAYMDSIEGQREFGLYLYHNFEPQSVQQFPKNEFFKEVCFNSYPSYFRRFFVAMKTNQSLNQKRFNRGHNKIEFFELQDTLQHYEAQFGQRICNLVFDVSGWTADSLIYDPNALADELNKKARLYNEAVQRNAEIAATTPIETNGDAQPRIHEMPKRPKPASGYPPFKDVKHLLNKDLEADLKL